MKTSIFILIALALISCNSKSEKAKANTEDQLTDNEELIDIYTNDQSDRKTEQIDWNNVSKRDLARRQRVYELLDSNKVRTSKDYNNAAMVFQHGMDSTSYGMAVKLIKKAIELDPNANKWLYAAATDRYLLSIGKPQIYGTQYQRLGANEPWKLGNIDTTQISDNERVEYGVETLAQQREKVKRMNLESLSSLLNNGKTVDEVIDIIKNEDKNNPVYNISETSINDLGYSIMDLEKEALKIFKLNTELYPEAYNTYDSYGECLRKIG